MFGIQLEVVHIAGSIPAPLLNVVAQPNDWQKSVKAATSPAAVGARGAAYVKFWASFLEPVPATHPDWTRTRRTSSDNWLGMKSSLKKNNNQIVTSFAQGDRLHHYLYVDTGEAETTAELYTFLQKRREAFEAAYGLNLFWEGLLGRRAMGF